MAFIWLVPLRELGDARHLRRLHGRDRDLQFERSQELFQAGGGALGANPFGPLRVQLRAAAVFLGNARAVESPDMRQESGDLGGPGGQRQGQHLGRARLRLGRTPWGCRPPG